MEEVIDKVGENLRSMRLKWIVVVGLVVASCSGNRNSTETKQPERVVDVPHASADSAYFFVRKQVDFGPRIPNTAAHRQTANYLVETLTHYGAGVTVQEFQAQSFDGQKLNLKNIIASFYPEKQKRILLAAHWDTRPFADKDREKPNASFDGANDGASGVGVLLEIARVLGGSSAAPQVGVDIILFDGEDWGEYKGAHSADKLPSGYTEWWCLGSQYWSTHKHKPNYSAYFGILLDMVGANGARFYKEGNSMQYAPTVADKVWKRASKLGYSNTFVPQNVGSIIDDHYFVNTVGKIPMVNVVHYDPVIGFFGDFHHTTKDNMEIINAETLRIVTDVVLNVVYYE